MLSDSSPQSVTAQACLGLIVFYWCSKGDGEYEIKI